MVRSGRRLSRTTAAVVITLALAMVATACGSSSKSDAGGDTGTTQPAATGTALKIGWIGTLTTATGTTPNGGKEAMDAWVKATNASGGIAGHPVSVVFADDKA